MTIVVVVAVVVDVDDLVVGCSAAMQDSERFCAEPAPGMGSLLRWAVPVDYAHLAESFLRFRVQHGVMLVTTFTADVLRVAVSYRVTLGQAVQAVFKFSDDVSPRWNPHHNELLAETQGVPLVANNTFVHFVAID